MALAGALTPRALSSWTRAMRAEPGAIPADRDALLFAFGCVRAALRLAAADLAHAMLSPFRSLHAMSAILSRPRLFGLLCAMTAVALGLVYLVTAGAPLRYPALNLAALALGVGAWLGLARMDVGARAAAVVFPPIAAGLLATALFGMGTDGATRWISLGGLAVQSSLVLLPAAILLYARAPGTVGTLAMIGAAVALALQPDRAMAAALAAGLAPLAFASGRGPRLALLAALCGLAVAFARPEVERAVPFVDRILFTAFDVQFAAGLAVVAGALLLLAPALSALNGEGEERRAVLAFAGVWAAIVAAAALGNFPTPLVGYGGSAVLGYVLSVALLPRQVGHHAARLRGGSTVSESASSAVDRARLGADPRLRPA